MFVDNAEAKVLGWEEEEDGLIEWLNSKKRDSTSSAHEEWSTPISEVSLQAVGSRLAVYVAGSSAALMQLPLIDPGFRREDYDMRHVPSRDPLMACYLLQEAGRMNLSAELLVSTVATSDAATLPFRITLTIVVSLLRPAIFEPIIYTTKTATSEVEEAQRRALGFIFPPARRDRSVDSEIDVPTLYAAIGPAPHLDPPSLEEKHQPVALLPTLLPFQRRTAAWLLAREHKALDTNRDVVDKQFSPQYLPLFWQAICVTPPGRQEETWFVNHVTGEISDEKPEDSDPPGGILAEEPGLGKTLESIALILLNPAVDRGPTQKVWNPDARIYAKKIKVRCPPALKYPLANLSFVRSTDHPYRHPRLSCATMGRRTEAPRTKYQGPHLRRLAESQGPYHGGRPGSRLGRKGEGLKEGKSKG